MQASNFILERYLSLCLDGSKFDHIVVRDGENVGRMNVKATGETQEFIIRLGGNSGM
jgi:hypothetical protein